MLGLQGCVTRAGFSLIISFCPAHIFGLNYVFDPQKTVVSSWLSLQEKQLECKLQAREVGGKPCERIGGIGGSVQRERKR